MLGAFRYTPNQAVLHTDSRVLPPAAAVRASWNYTLSCQDGQASTPARVSYHMNRLQGLPSDQDYIVTLGGRQDVDPARIIAVMDYAHPAYTRESVAAQSRLPELNTSVTAFAGALPSRIQVKLPANVAEQIETARRSYHRFGEFSNALSQIRGRIEHKPLEKEQLRSLCWNLGIPVDFDIAQISWKPDYDPFFYRQLCRRARRLYLLRDQYIFELQGGIAVETPQLGHATYLFSKPRSIEGFLAAYTGATKEAIRQNRANLAERLGFLGRVVHGSNPKIWLRSLKQHLGEAADYARGGIRLRVSMQGTNTKAEIIALLEGRPEEFLGKIHQFIVDLDELEHIEFLYPSDPDFAQELDERAAEAQGDA